MSAPRDDEPVGIEADAPEADWIEQHQSVVDEPDSDLFPTEVREDDEPVGVEADAPEADWIEQHQPVVDEPDSDVVPVVDLSVDLSVDVDDGDVGTDDERPAATPAPPVVDETSEDHQQLDPPRASLAARGCNLIGVLLHALLRSGRDPSSRS